MIKKLLALSVAALVTTNVYAKAGQSYTQIGYERIGVEFSDGFKPDDSSMAALTLGYNFTNNIAVEFAGMLPFSSDTQSEVTDYYREYNNENGLIEESDFSEVMSETYSNDFETKGVASINLKLNLPLHERFSTFVNIGYSYASFKGNYHPFTDNAPSLNIEEDFANGATLCDLTGNEGKNYCNNPIVNNTDSDSFSGFTYGAGFSLHLENNSSFVFEYNSYINNDDIKVDGVSASYMWKF